MSGTEKPVNDIGDLIGKLDGESLDYKQKASTTLADASLSKTLSGVIDKTLNELRKVAADIDRKQDEGRRALAAAQQNYSTSLTELPKHRFNDDEHKKLSGIMVSIDVDVENYQKAIKRAKRDQVVAELRMKRAKLSEEDAKSKLDQDLANLINLPKAIQERLDDLGKLNKAFGDALDPSQLDVLGAAIALTDYKVRLDAGKGLPDEGKDDRKYPLKGYDGLDRLVSDDFENDLVDKIIKDVRTRADEETPVDADGQPITQAGSLRRYLNALEVTSKASSDLEKAKVTLKASEDALKALQSERMDRIKRLYKKADAPNPPPPASPPAH